MAGGAALPPHPVLIAVGAGAGEFQASVAGTTDPMLPPKGWEPKEFVTGAEYAAGCIAGVAEDKLGVGTPLVGNPGVLLAVPFSFSCVRP